MYCGSECLHKLFNISIWSLFEYFVITAYSNSRYRIKFEKKNITNQVPPCEPDLKNKYIIILYCSGDTMLEGKIKFFRERSPRHK